jgi:Flp pilus assembly protein TadB
VTAVWLLAAAWGGLAAAATTGLARRGGARRRVRALASTRPRPPRAVGGAGARLVAALGPVARVAAGIAAARRRYRDDNLAARDLPVVVDIVAVAVASGSTPYLAFEHARRWSPPALRAAFEAVADRTRLGASLPDALEAAAALHPPLAPLGAVLSESHRLGSPAGPALARVAADLRADLRRRAETSARSMSVRLLFPLVFLVLPGFALLTVAPALIGGLRAVGG